VGAGCPAAPYGARRSAPGTGKTVALTFDDGPGASTGRIVSVLRKQGVTATFFNLGQNMAAAPGRVRSEALAGYFFGNHTWDHQWMSQLTATRQAREMDQASAEQKRLVGAGLCAFRPPGGYYNSTTLRLAQQRKMKFWTWSVDTEDWKAQGSPSQYWVNRIIRLAEQQGKVLRHPVVLMHNQPAGNPATAAALPAIIRFFRGHGYKFVDLLGRTGQGYLVTTANGGVHSFGTPWHGSLAGKLSAGVTATALATNPFTGGYWIAKSNGGVNNFQAPWYGSLAGKLPAGQQVTGIAASRGGYLVLTSNGGVHNFGAPWYGSLAGKLTGGVTATGLASNPATGGYWVLKSNGGVTGFHAPRLGGLAGKLPTGTTANAIAAGARGGYLVLTSNGGVYNFGTPWYGSLAGKLADDVTATGLAVAPATSGYWILKSNGGVNNFHAPWHGSLAGRLPHGETVTGIGGA
jgi:peptidoglycan/xylan/chitin deacetylase (PgdA/CDA1 family)